MLRKIMRIGWLFVALALFITPAAAAGQAGPGQKAVLLQAEGPLTSSMVNYIDRGISRAEADRAALVILQLDTPGGEIGQMQEIIQRIRRSQVPVVVYVGPPGAMAASAGTLITLAGHASAMAPETMIGAASPVGGSGEDIGETMASKVKETMKALARDLAADRSADAIRLAEESIDEARAASAHEAYEIGLVDYIASSPEDLLAQLDGAEVNLQGETVVLRTSGLALEVVPPTVIEQVLQFLTNPNVVFLLLTIGVQAILIELSNPGGWIAGVIGVSALALAVYGLGVLPVNWFGLIFIILAFVLFAFELATPTHGALSVAGVISFIIGALVLFNSARLPGFPPVSVPLVVGTGAILALSFSIIVGYAVRSMRAPARMGKQALIGQRGQVREPLDPLGSVHVAGELWTAEVIDEAVSLPAGTPIEVVAVEGLRLKVRPLR